MGKIGQWIGKVVRNYNDIGLLKNIRMEVTELALEFPLYPRYEVLR